MSDAAFSVTDLKTHPDARGDLFEILRFKDQKVPADGYIYCVTIAPGARRGDHYHEHKLEWFTCVSGEATILIEEQGGAQHKVELSARQPKLVFCAPFTAHALLNRGTVPAVIVSYGSKQFDPADPDTIKKVIAYEGV